MTKTISKEIPLAEITLRRYEKPSRLSDRELVRKLCLSTGLLQPGDSRDVIVDIFHVLIKAKKLKPDLIAMECSTPSIITDLETVKLLKEKMSTFIVLMGSHSTYFHEEILKENEFVDAIIRGEFDSTIKDLVLTLQTGKDELKIVEGISYRENEQIKVKYGLSGLIKPLRSHLSVHASITTCNLSRARI